ncbi:MAG: purine-nucleoside phosphorylase [Actinomycetes bacterium]
MGVSTAVAASVRHIQKTTRLRPRIAIVLGTGLGALADQLSDPVVLPYRSIPHFPESTVANQIGAVVIGRLRDRPVSILQGRFHLYQGYSASQVSYPIDVLAALGVQTLIVSNAAGGINESFSPGDLMLITDHINLSGANPLVGDHDPSQPSPFIDMSDAYSPHLAAVAQAAARTVGIEHRNGVYLGTLGPSFETAAEIRFMRSIGADAVGMSTVQEVIKARYLAMEVLGISCITNMATGVAGACHDYDEMIAVADKSQERLSRWVDEIVGQLPK